MMAVESNKGGNGTVPATGTPAAGSGVAPGPAATLAGMPAMSANGRPKRKRPSSLMAQAAELPSVENSLDEFIARANETLVDPESFNSAKIARAAEDEQRKEADAVRWKAAEQQMRESQAREQSLRRQLDGLQGQLAAAEARASVSGMGGSQDGVVADLKVRLSGYDDKLREAEARSQQLARELEAAKQAQAAVSLAAASDSLTGAENEELEQRARIAEAKAAKALAAARAAAAGLTVSNADLAAIESGLVVTEQPKKGMSWGGVIAAFIVGGAIMFAVAFVLLKKDGAKTSANTAPAANAQQAAQPQTAPTPPVAPAKAAPVVTPIDDDSAKAAAKTDGAAQSGPAGSMTRGDTAKTDDTAKADDTAAAKPDDSAKTDDSAKAADDAAAKKAEEAAAKKAAAEEAAAAKKAAAEEAAAKKSDQSAAKKAAAQQAAANRAAAAKAAAEARAQKAAAAKAAAAKKQSSAGIADPFGDSTPAPAPKKKADKKASGGGGIVDPF